MKSLPAFVIVLLFTVTPMVSLADVAPPGDVRDRLTHEELMADTPNEDGPIHNDYFMPVGLHEPALHELSGVLVFSATEFLEDTGQTADMYGLMLNESGHLIPAEEFPEFAASFMTVQGHLVPVERDVIRTQSPDWDVVLSPGRVWTEPGDDGWSRASFPFVLVGQKWNDTHNGIATFLYNETETSDLQFQIVQESAEWWRFYTWARVPLAYQPGPVAQRQEFEAAFADELARRLPTAPLASLDASSGAIDGMTHNLKHLTLTGLVSDGTFYRTPCYTRFGDYPYCDAMRHSVYNVSVSAGAALSLLWLAEKYGPHVLDLKIVDYVDVVTHHDGWQDVTFLDAIDMATGIGSLAGLEGSRRYDFEDDLEALYYAQFHDAADAQGRLDAAFLAGNYSWGPGEIARYSTAQTFVLTAAMDAYLKQEEGPDAHLWERVSNEVLLPIGVHHLPMAHTRESDGEPGLPLLHSGLLPTGEDLAKIAMLIHDRGAVDGRQVLYADEIDRLLEGDLKRGLPINWRTRDGQYGYDFSFWFMPFTSADGCWVRIPKMMGNGNIVALMPNGTTAIRLADATPGTPGMYEAENMAALADNLRSFCEVSP
ncbi:MAG: hypothetical protein AAF563_11620 [Pseudomonadota bacterium]